MSGPLLPGEHRAVPGSGSRTYIIRKDGDVTSCSCQAWLFQKIRVEHRTCKHLKRELGEAVERERILRATQPKESEESEWMKQQRKRGEERTEQKMKEMYGEPKKPKPERNLRKRGTVMDEDGNSYDLVG